MASQQNADCQLVLSTIATLGASSQGAWSTFAATLPHAIAEPSGSRHALQDELLSVLSDSLQRCLDETRAGGVALATRLQVASEAAEGGRAHAAEGDATVAKSTKALAERDDSLRAAKEAVSSAEADRTEVEALKAAALQQQEEAQRTHAEDSSVASGPLSLLTTGGWGEDEETRDTVMEAVVALLKRAGAEPTMLAAAQGTFGQKPAKRRRFDKVVEETVSEVVERRVALLKTALDAAEKDADEANAEAIGLWAIADLAREAAAQAKEDAKVAKAELEDARQKQAEAAEDDARLQTVVANLAKEQITLESKSKLLMDAIETVQRLRADEYTSNQDTTKQDDAEVLQADTTVEVLQNVAEDACPAVPKTGETQVKVVDAAEAATARQCELVPPTGGA